MKTLFYSFVFLSTSLLAQKPSRQIIVDSGIVYQNYHSGLTTNHVANTSASIDSIPEAIKKPISKKYLDTLSIILTNLKHARHFQQKLGWTNYAKVYINGIPYRLAFFDNWAIIDFTTIPHRQIVIKNTKYTEIYKRFILNNWH